MPTVPQYGGPRVATAPLPSVRVPVEAPRGAFESGTQQALPAAINASAQRDAIAEKAALDADEIAVNAAKVAHINQQARDLQDPENGVLNMRGTNALGALPQAQQRYKKLTDDIAGSLKNDRQRAMYAHFAQNQYGEVLQEVTAHTRAEYNKADIESTNSLLNNGLAKVHVAPEQAESAITEARKAIIAFGARQGWSSETLKLKDAVHVSDIHAAAISSLVQRGTYEAAQQADAYLKAHRAELRGGQLDDAEKLVDTALGEGSGYAEADKILGINQDTPVLPSVGQEQGIVAPGNIDLTNRPRVKNADGSVSTVRSISIDEDGKTVLIPTVVGDKVVSDNAAIAHYKKTGENLGTFKDEKSATAYAKSLHEAQAASLDGQGDGAPQQQQGPATSRAEALARAEAIRDPKARKAATDAIVSHFTRLEQMQHLDRQDALQKVVAHIEATGGRLPRASREYQLLVGHPEEAHALSAQDRILRPPKDPGDPELFMSHLNMATISPASREHFVQLDFTGKDGKGLNTSQRTRLIQMQGQLRGQDARANAPDPAGAEKLRFERENALLKIGDPASKDYITNKAERDAEVSRIKRHYNQLQAAHGEAVAPAPSRIQPQQGSGDVHLGGESAVPVPVAAPLFANQQAPTQSMLDDVVRKGPKYADYLRQHGYDVPAYEALVLEATQKAGKP